MQHQVDVAGNITTSGLSVITMNSNINPLSSQSYFLTNYTNLSS
jgi:hypothetical protein